MFPQGVIHFLSFFLLSLASVVRAQVVINEINYRPGTGYPENHALEFIELHNPTAAAVNIGGWAITSGTSFTIPPGKTIPAGGYVVIAANISAVQSAYGISGVLGPWQAGSTLANGGEKITLSKPGVIIGTYDEVDAVAYASEGDWATRVRETTFNGWDWTTPANGGNKSMELRNPLISNDNGQNWAPSTAPLGASPGAPNSVLTGNVAPIIHDVKHSPAVPKPADSVTISCEVTDESAPQFLAATLFWRDATAPTPPAFQQQTMVGDSSGRFSTVLGPKANLAIVEFYISVNDGVSTRTWPAATSQGQIANCQYQVTDEALDPAAAYYFLVLSGPENAAYNTTAATDSPQNKNDRQFNTTLIVSNGNDTTIRYRSAIRFRGNSSRSYQFKPLRVSLPNDDTLDGETTFNLNPRAPYLQFVGMRLLQLSGVRAPDSIPVKPRRNGVEYSTSSGSTPDYGFWVREEDIGAGLVSNHWPDAKGGNIYKKVDNGGALNFYWRSGQNPPSNPNTVFDGWSKQNNSSANDWSDLTTFFQTWQAAAAPHFPGSAANDVAGSNNTRISGNGNWNNTAFTNAEMTSLATVSDFDQWARWFAVMTILQDYETNISNGVDDDYSAYFAPSPTGERRMNLVSHDMDTILGLGDTTQAPTATGLYDMTEGGQGGFGGGGGLAFRTLLPLFGTATTAGNAAFRQKYFDAIRELFGTVFNANTSGDPNPAFYQFIDSHLTGWAPPQTIAAIKSWMTQRQAHLLGLIGSGVITPPAATSSASVASSPGTLMINEVLANNVTAHLNGGSYPDVVEIYNAGGTPIDLAGKSITDDSALKTKYTFPAGTIIAAGGYVVVYADLASGAPGLHTGFALDGDGDGVYLYDSAANGQTLLDSIVFGIQPADFTIGRTGAARDLWTLCTPTIGGANSAVAAFAPPGGLKINEWAGNSDYLIEDFVEIYNPAAQPVAVGQMTLTDDFINAPAKSVLPNLSFIAPGGFVQFKAKGSAASDGNASELPFRIDANFGVLALVGQNGSIVDRVDVVAQAADTSRGRSPDGGAAVATFALPSTLPTPGAANVSPPAGVLALINNLRISELLYAPNNLEYIELHNIGAAALDLSGVRFTQGITYTFDPGTTLAAGAYLVVCRDRAAFQAQFGATGPLAAGTFSGSLDNAGESIAIQPAAPWNVNILNFKYETTWFGTETDNGYALTLINDRTTAPLDWNDRINWSSSPSLFGTPGADSPPTITSALNVTGYTTLPFNYQVTATKNPTAFTASPLPAGLSIDATGLISGTPTATGIVTVTLGAINGTGTGSRTLNLTISTPPPPSIISSGIVTGIVGTAFTHQIVATNGAFEYSATGLPSGLNVNVDTGLISGAPTQTGIFNATLSATNAFGTGRAALQLTISLPPAPVITSAESANGVANDPFTYQIIAVNNPASYGADDLPPGLNINTASGLITGAATVTGTFTVTLRAVNPGGTALKILNLTIASSGPLANFVWSAVPPTQQVGVPFSPSLTARDAQGRTVTSFTGNVTVTGEGPGISAAIVLITECGTGNVDYFEIENVGNTAANTTGWFIIPNNAGGTGGGISARNAVWQLPATIAPRQVITVSENSAGIYPTQIDWSSGFGGTRNGWCMLCDQTGAVRDFVAWGYTAANVTSINLTNVAVGTNTYASITVPPTQWTGNGTVADFFSGIKSRTGSTDRNIATDWLGSNSEANKNVQNTGLIVPFVPPPPSVPVTPGIVTVLNGVWNGTLAVSQLTTGMRVVANNGAGISAASNTFDVVTPPAPVIASASKAIGVVGGPFSYQILGTNAPTSFGATGLPAGLNFNTETGVISGTPSAVGTTNVPVSATNLGGTGELMVAIEVQPDADGDGLGDVWEAANGLSTTANDAAADLDRDGRTNIEEWVAGTAPNDANSNFRITSSAVVGGNVVISWSAVPGKRYRVFTNPDLSSSTWTEVTLTPVAATTTTGSFSHFGGGSGVRRFYRVSVEP